MIWIGGRLLKGLALRLDLDSALRRLLRGSKDPRGGQIFTCLCWDSLGYQKCMHGGHLCTPNREILGYIYKPTSGKRPTEGMSLWWMR